MALFIMRSSHHHNQASLTSSTTTTAAAPAASTMTFRQAYKVSSLPPLMNNLCVMYRQLEENINKWSLELEDMEKVFLNQATMVNAWDQMLIKNGAKIVSLNESVAAVRADQQRLEHELDFVASQVCKSFTRSLLVFLS